MYILKKIRLELEMTGPEFADLLGIHSATLYNYESGRRRPKYILANQYIGILKKRGYKLTIEQLKDER